MMATALGSGVADVERYVRELTGSHRDYDDLLELIGGKRFVLLGEATHGTHEFYRERARITRRLIEDKGFVAVAVEGDWPDAYRVNRYVLGQSNDTHAAAALEDFSRFPAWMLAAARAVLLREQPVRDGHRVDRSESETDIALKASAYEMPAWPVDGMDVIAVEDAATRAADAVRHGGGPHLLELRTYRFRAHSMYDPELYRSKDEVERWKQRDPIPVFIDRCRSAGLVTDEDIESIEADVAAEIGDAVDFADAGTVESVDELTRFVVSEAVAP